MSRFKSQAIWLLALVAGVFLLTGCGAEETASTSSSAEVASSSSEAASSESYETVETTAVTKDVVVSAVADDAYVIVDARQNDAYIGWKLDGVSRGGHIEGAVDFAANWLDVENENKAQILKDAMATKGITADKKVIIYDANGSDAQKVANYFGAQGLENISTFDINEWADDAALELVQYPDYQMLVPAQVVKQIADGDKPETFETAGEVKIVEASWGKIEGPEGEASPYADGHIAGSPHINTDAIEPPPAWMLADDATLIKFANEYGFTPEDTVIVYGKDTLAAHRVAYVLRYLGVKDVRLMNGGLAAWERMGYPLVTETTEPTPGTAYTSADVFNKDLVTTQDELKENMKKDGHVLVDNRTWNEYIGKESGYSYHDKKGRIPGAIFGYSGKNDEGSSSVSYFHNIDMTMRRGQEIEELWTSQGIDLNAEHIDNYCGSGWRAAEIATYFQILGHDNVALYSDGWIGWSNNSEHPTETGEPEDKPKYME